MHFKLKQVIIIVFVSLISLLLGFLFKGSDKIGVSDYMYQGILVISIFLFGLLIAFSISDRKTRFSEIRENLRRQDAVLVSIYLFSHSFGEKIKGEVRNKLDDFLISQIDWSINDFHKHSSVELKKLFIFMTELKPKTEEQKEMKSKIMDKMSEISEIHSKVIYQVNNKLTRLEWATLFLLSFVMMFTLYYGNDQSWISMIMITLQGGCLCILLIILNQYDSLLWQEQNWIWNPLTDLFISLDLVPYVPEVVFKDRKVNHREFRGETLRVVHYPHPYPNCQDKTIKLVKIKDIQF